MRNPLKKHHVIVSTLLIGIALFTSCSKDRDDPAPKIYPEENPLALYLQSSGFLQKTVDYVNFSTNYEFGYRFKPNVKGKINAVTFKIPANKTNVRVTLWDVATKTPLKTVTIPNAPANTEIKQSMESFAVEPNTEYLISYNGNSWYHRTKSDNSNVVYPISAGNISITGYNYDPSTITAQTYPVSDALSYYGGDLSIVFQQVD